MKKFVNVIIGIVLLIMGIMNYILVRDLEQKTLELIELTDLENELMFVVDSVEIFDTVYFNHFDTVKLETIKKDTITKLDSIFVLDSVDVFIPISTYHYDTTLAETHISLICEGFDVRLDTLLVERIKVPTIEQKTPKKWCDNFGIGLGLGATYCDGLKILPTLGIYYKLF